MSKSRLFAPLLLLIISSFGPAEPRLTIFLIGDSTMANKLPTDAPETGWGMVLNQYFNESIDVQNHALNGRSTKSFINEKRWDNVLKQIKKGDWVFIQFGHNDQKTTDSTRSAPAQTLYRQNLLKFINETRAKGGNPLLITPVERRKFDADGVFVEQHGDYPAVVKDVAAATMTPLIDLHAKSQAVIEANGVEGSKRLFMHHVGGIYTKFPKGIADDTHFSHYGAEVIASIVMESLMQLPIDLKSYVKRAEFPEKYQFELPKYYTPVFRKDTFDIARYGAKPDGQTVNTKAINQAIELCSQAGGGVVQVPAGLWLTGPIVLKSNVNLYIKKGGLLQFSRNFDDYPVVLTTWEGQDSYRCQAPIWGVDLFNVAITGSGTIDGGGDAWRMVKKDKMTDSQWKKLIASGGVLSEQKNTWYPSNKSLIGNKLPNAGRVVNGVVPTMDELMTYKDFLRPNMLSLMRCQNVLLQGVTFQNSPAWCLHPLLCTHITLKDLSVKNPWYAQNGDGVDLESCRNGLIDNCTFDVGDDGICIKSGRDEAGRKRGVPTENIVVKDSKVYHAHGGFVIGSEMSGGARNIFVSNCSFMGTDVGLRFKTTRGRGGIVEKIYVNHVNMTDIAGEAVLFDMYYAAKDPVPQAGEKRELPVIETKPVNETTPQFREFYVRNVHCIGAETGILVRGLPEMNVRDILIENAVIEANKGLVCVEGTNIELKNITLLTQDKTIGTIQNSQNVTLTNIGYKTNSELLLDIQGDRTKKIKLLNTDTSKAQKTATFGEKVSKTVLSLK
jgi:DNA sulfur modification protein DndE